MLHSKSWSELSCADIYALKHQLHKFSSFFKITKWSGYTYIHRGLRSAPNQEYLHHDRAQGVYDNHRFITQPISEQKYDYQLRKRYVRSSWKNVLIDLRDRSNKLITVFTTYRNKQNFWVRINLLGCKIHRSLRQILADIRILRPEFFQEPIRPDPYR